MKLPSRAKLVNKINKEEHQHGSVVKRRSSRERNAVNYSEKNGDKEFNRTVKSVRSGESRRGDLAANAPSPSSFRGNEYPMPGFEVAACDASHIGEWAGAWEACDLLRKSPSWPLHGENIVGWDGLFTSTRAVRAREHCPRAQPLAGRNGRVGEARHPKKTNGRDKNTRHQEEEGKKARCASVEETESFGETCICPSDSNGGIDTRADSGVCNTLVVRKSKKKAPSRRPNRKCRLPRQTNVPAAHENVRQWTSH